MLPWLLQQTHSVTGEVEYNEPLAEKLVGQTEAEECSTPDGNLHLHLESVETQGAKDIQRLSLSPGHICTTKQFLFPSLPMKFPFLEGQFCVHMLSHAKPAHSEICSSEVAKSKIQNRIEQTRIRRDLQRSSSTSKTSSIPRSN